MFTEEEDEEEQYRAAHQHQAHQLVHANSFATGPSELPQ